MALRDSVSSVCGNTTKLNIFMQHSINSGVNSNFVFSSIKFRGPIGQRLKKKEKILEFRIIMP